MHLVFSDRILNSVLDVFKLSALPHEVWTDVKNILKYNKYMILKT